MELHFDLFDIKLFAIIAEKKTLTRGAEDCHISLAAASKRIKNVEDRLGAPLFYRNSQGVTLTPLGNAFLDHGRLILEQVERLQGVLQGYTKGATGEIRIFANTTAIADFLPKVLRRYLVSHPDVNIELREGASLDIVHAVIQGTTDIGIAADYVCTDGLEVLPYRHDRLVLATASKHPLARRKNLNFDETLKFNYIGVEASAIQSFLNRVVTDLHQTLRIRIQVSNFEELCRMVEASVGIGVLPESAARRHRKTMDFRIIQLNDGWAAHKLQICVRRLESLPQFAQELINLMIEDAGGANR
jgi:DNA-binding transcriptional LysR family regulator